MIQITKTSDLLKCKPIAEVSREVSEEAVKMVIAQSLLKCSAAMNIQMPQPSLEVIAEDIIDKYKFESVEDIIECLKKGRRGDYATDKDSKAYGKLNMEVISIWMTKHLDVKYQEREKAIQNEKKGELEDNFDAAEFYKKGKEYIDFLKEKEKKSNSFSGSKYDEIKHQYFNKKGQEF
jgi:hypothetical protein